MKPLIFFFQTHYQSLSPERPLLNPAIITSKKVQLSVILSKFPNHSFSHWVIWIITHCKFWVITQSLMLAWLPKCDNYVGKSWVQMRYDAIPVKGEDDMKSLIFFLPNSLLVSFARKTPLQKSKKSWKGGPSGERDWYSIKEPEGNVSDFVLTVSLIFKTDLSDKVSLRKIIDFTTENLWYCEDDMKSLILLFSQFRIFCNHRTTIFSLGKVVRESILGEITSLF